LKSIIYYLQGRLEVAATQTKPTFVGSKGFSNTLLVKLASTTIRTMQLLSKHLLRPIFSLTFLVGLSALVSSCQPSQSNETTTAIKINGSDTVYPITQEVSNDYNFQKNKRSSQHYRVPLVASTPTALIWGCPPLFFAR
jgi:ABC-type phosphate transport system substrate-binding protein